MNHLKIPVSNDDHIRGNKNAPVTLVEYGDYECPHCGEAYPMLRELQKREGDTMRFVYRNFPLSEIHPDAQHAAYAAEAAGLQGKFWEMHDILFENQDALSDSDLMEYAEEIGLDTEKFMKDVTSESIAEKVKSEFINGARSGVNGTPTFFINGVRYDGSYDIDALQNAIEGAEDTKRHGASI